MIELVVSPTTPPLSWVEFCGSVGPFSIALDGYVSAGPKFDPSGPRWNANHHEEVDRLATRSTCAQVLMAVRQGLYSTFRDEKGAPKATVYVNDCDEDVCTAWTVLKHPHLVESVMNPALNRLVAMEDALDCTAGAYPFPANLPALRELAWVFEPYRRFRMSGQLEKKDADAFRSVITDVENRILMYLAGRGKEIDLDTRYRRIGGTEHWAMVHEFGAQARTGMFADGIKIFLSVRSRPEVGKYTYTIGKVSPFIPVDLVKLAERLNVVEVAPHNDCWGGSDTIIGSPRVAGSKLSPDEVGEHLSRACALLG